MGFSVLLFIWNSDHFVSQCGRCLTGFCLPHRSSHREYIVFSFSSRPTVFWLGDRVFTQRGWNVVELYLGSPCWSFYCRLFHGCPSLFALIDPIFPVAKVTRIW